MFLIHAVAKINSDFFLSLESSLWVSIEFCMVVVIILSFSLTYLCFSKQEKHLVSGELTVLSDQLQLRNLTGIHFNFSVLTGKRWCYERRHLSNMSHSIHSQPFSSFCLAHNFQRPFCDC